MAERSPVRPEPARLGRYVLLDELASGGMATVYRARLEGPEGFGRIVALKRPHPHLARNKSVITMFLDEVRMAARIRHVNVVPMLDVIDEGGQVALVMEYVEGESLAGLLQAACRGGLRVPLGVAARIACDALEGLHAAHEARGESGKPLGLVHRDVSPHNVLVGTDGLTRVIDFGIAKAEGRAYQTTRTGAKGKLSYVAPEYLSKGELDRRSDVYSAAVVLWETVAGRRLFTGHSEHQVMARVLGFVVPPLAAERPETPPALAQIVARALSRDPDARFPDAQAMARALRGALPLAGNDEVGAWVRSLAAESLAARADALNRAQQATAARGPTAPTSEEPASHRRPVLSLIDLTAPPADGLSSAAPGARRVRRALGVAATVVASMCAVGLSWAYLWPEAPPARPAATWVLAAPLASAMPAEASLQALAASGALGPPQATDAEPARRSVFEPSAELAAHPPPASNAGRVRVALPVREKRKPSATTPTSCDPPYTYDREGIRHFKPQCL